MNSEDVMLTVLGLVIGGVDEETTRGGGDGGVGGCEVTTGGDREATGLGGGGEGGEG